MQPPFHVCLSVAWERGVCEWISPNKAPLHHFLHPVQIPHVGDRNAATHHCAPVGHTDRQPELGARAEKSILATLKRLLGNFTPKPNPHLRCPLPPSLASSLPSFFPPSPTSFFPPSAPYFYLFLEGRAAVREGDRRRSSICWFSPPRPWRSGLGQAKDRSHKLHFIFLLEFPYLGPSMVVQWLKFSPCKHRDPI